MFYYIFILMIDMAKLVYYFIVWLFQVIYNIFSKKKIHINFTESSFKKTNVKSNKGVKRNYKDEEFDKEAKLWGLSEEDKRIAKEERMSPADFIEAEERDDDELITNELTTCNSFNTYFNKMYFVMMNPNNGEILVMSAKEINKETGEVKDISTGNFLEAVEIGSTSKAGT